MATDLQMDLAYLGRVIQTVSQVLAAGKKKRLFDDQADGWFYLASRQGESILSVNTSPIFGEHTVGHRLRTEEEVFWLVTNDALTSSVFHERRPSPAVAVTGYSFLFSYTSELDHLWNEAIAVVIAIRMNQFNKEITRDQRWHLCHNPRIASLLKVAHWTE